MTMRAPAAVVALTLLGVLFALRPPAARAQLHHLDEAPWSAAADTAGRGGATMSWDLTTGGEPGWRTERVGLTFRVPVGERAMVFLRGRYVRFETGERPVLARWPQLRSDDPDVDLPDDWPGEANLEDFGQPELGLIFPLALPLLGAGDAALMAMLPFGKDELYPVASRALVMRLDWRRAVLRLGALEFAGRVGWEFALDASGDVFAAEAFPDGARYAVTAGSPLDRAHGLTLGWSARELEGGRHTRGADLAAWTALADRHRLLLTLRRELGVRAHRLGDWRVGVAFQLRGLPAAEGD